MPPNLSSPLLGLQPRKQCKIQVHTNKLCKCSLQMTVFIKMGCDSVNSRGKQPWEHRDVGWEGWMCPQKTTPACTSSIITANAKPDKRDLHSISCTFTHFTYFLQLLLYKLRENYTLKWAPCSHHCHRIIAAHPLPLQPLFHTFGWFLFALFSSLGLACALVFSVLPFKPWFPKILEPLPPSSHKGPLCFSTRPLDSRFSSASSKERHFIKTENLRELHNSILVKWLQKYLGPLCTVTWRAGNIKSIQQGTRGEILVKFGR